MLSQLRLMSRYSSLAASYRIGGTTVSKRNLVKLAPEDSVLFPAPKRSKDKNKDKLKRKSVIKSDVWPGLENTRTWMYGRVKRWSTRHGYGVVVPNRSYGVGHMQYYVHWQDIAGTLALPYLKKGAPVAFEVVEEDRINTKTRFLARTHCFDIERARVRRGGHGSRVRAINVHQLNRMNWQEDSVVGRKENFGKKDAVRAIELDREIARKLAEDPDMSEKFKAEKEETEDDVLRNVRARKDVRLTYLKDRLLSEEEAEMIRHSSKSVDEMDKQERKRYLEHKRAVIREYPYRCEQVSDVREVDVAKYNQWFPHLHLKHQVPDASKSSHTITKLMSK